MLPCGALRARTPVSGERMPLHDRAAQVLVPVAHIPNAIPQRLCITYDVMAPRADTAAAEQACCHVQYSAEQYSAIQYSAVQYSSRPHGSGMQAGILLRFCATLGVQLSPHAMPRPAQFQHPNRRPSVSPMCFVAYAARYQLATAPQACDPVCCAADPARHHLVTGGKDNHIFVWGADGTLVDKCGTGRRFNLFVWCA